MKGGRQMGAITSYLIQMAFPALAGALLWAVSRPRRKRRLALRGQRAGSARESALLLCFMFTAGLLALTLTPAGFWTSVLQGQRPELPQAFQGGINLIPFRRSWELLCFYVRHDLWEAVLINFPGNILMFAPIGLFAALLSDKPRWWKGTLWAFALSLFIETFQLFVSRGTDVDDLILNALGGLLGHGLFLLLRWADPGLVRRCGKV